MDFLIKVEVIEREHCDVQRHGTKGPASKQLRQFRRHPVHVPRDTVPTIRADEAFKPISVPKIEPALNSGPQAIDRVSRRQTVNISDAHARQCQEEAAGLSQVREPSLFQPCVRECVLLREKQHH